MYSSPEELAVPNQDEPDQAAVLFAGVALLVVLLALAALTMLVLGLTFVSFKAAGQNLLSIGIGLFIITEAITKLSYDDAYARYPAGYVNWPFLFLFSATTICLTVGGLWGSKRQRVQSHERDRARERLGMPIVPKP